MPSVPSGPIQTLVLQPGLARNWQCPQTMPPAAHQAHEVVPARGHTVSFLPIVLGNTGSVYTTNGDVLRALGVTRATREQLLTSLSIHIISMHKIIRTRRQLEHQCMQQQLRRPGPP